MNGPSELGLDRLMQDGAWLRRFVGTLVAPQDVDDVVQSAWLAAVEDPGGARGPVAAWLRGVSANVARLLHRSRHRRARAFGRLPPPDDAPATADVVAGLEVQRAVSEALLALPEPTRTIVVLRYQQSLSPAAIGARVGLRVDAVRQRLHRGREAVRERLQQRFGADWRGSAAIVAFALDGGAIAPAVAMAPLLLAAAATLAVVTASLVAWPATAPTLPADVATTVLASNTHDATPPPAADAPLGAERQLVAGAAQEPKPGAQPERTEVRGRIVAAEDRAPIAHATVAGSPSRAPVTTGPDGRFVLVADTQPSQTIWFRAAGRVVRWHERESAGTVDLGDISLARGGTVRGRVVDEAGAPIAKVRIEAPIDGAFPAPRDGIAVGDAGASTATVRVEAPASGPIGMATETNADGSFAFDTPLPYGAIELRSGTPGVVLTDGAVTLLEQQAPVDLALHARQLRSISGVVFDGEGRPCAGVDVRAYATAVTRGGEPRSLLELGQAPSRADGSFELFEALAADEVFVGVAEAGPHELVGARIASAWGVRGLQITVRQHIPVRLLVVEAETGSPITCFAARATARVNGVSYGHGNAHPDEHAGGRYTFEGLPAGADIAVWCQDAMRAPTVVIVDESMRDAETVRVALPKLQSFRIVLVDGAGEPVSTAFDLIDRCGDPRASMWSDPLRNSFGCDSFAKTPAPLRLSGGTSDRDGKATLLAPSDARDLAICVRRDKRKAWVPVVLPAPGATLRLVVPD